MKKKENQKKGEKSGGENGRNGLADFTEYDGLFPILYL